jgi:hypothetical protein
MRYHVERLLKKELEEAGQGMPEEEPEKEVLAATPESPAEATDPSAAGDEEELQRDS